jgi:hypothetical protein
MLRQKYRKSKGPKGLLKGTSAEGKKARRSEGQKARGEADKMMDKKGAQ